MKQATQIYVMVHYVREMTVKKSCKYGEYESFEHLLLLLRNDCKVYKKSFGDGLDLYKLKQLRPEIIKGLFWNKRFWFYPFQTHPPPPPPQNPNNTHSQNGSGFIPSKPPPSPPKKKNPTTPTHKMVLVLSLPPPQKTKNPNYTHS